jgi:hypothetical protein
MKPLRMRMWMVAASLLLAAPLAAFLTTNQYPVASAEVGILLAACLAAGVVLGCAAALGTLVGALVLGAATVLALDFMYGVHFSKAALLLVPLVCLTLAAALRRHFALVVVAASSAFLAATLVIPSTAADAPPPAAPGVQQASASDRPVVLHLVLDEHIGIGGVPQELPESAAFARWLTEAYLQAGFRIYSGAYSEYFDTRNSLANLLNFTSSEDSWSHLERGQAKPYVLTDSAYFKHLEGLGYRLHVYQSDHIDLCRVPRVAYASCLNYRSNSIGALNRTTLGTVERAQFIFNSFIASSNYLNRTRTALRKLTGSEWDHAVSRVGPIPVLPVLQQLERDLRSASRGHAYFAHLLIPHYPYVLDEVCQVRDEIEQWLYNVSAAAAPGGPAQNTAASRAERYRRYFEQIRCQQALLQRLFDALKDAGVWDDALVVVHGDHGSRIVRRLPVTANAARLTEEDINDAFSALFAVRKAGLEAGVVTQPRPLQELLGETFGLKVGKLTPRVYLRANREGLMPLPRDRSQAPRSPDGR